MTAQVYAQLESVEGLEHLDNAIALGKGIAGGSAHFGNFNMFVHLTAVHLHKQHEVVVPVERLKPEAVFEIVTQTTRGARHRTRSRGCGGTRAAQKTADGRDSWARD